MDKKRTINVVAAVCFIIACGAVYLVCSGNFGGQEEIVFEKQSGETRVNSETAPEGEEEERPLYVHICGAVAEEGVYVLPQGSRVADGIQSAGGFRADADESFHNLAATMFDGQKIYVPTVEETKSLPLTERINGSEERESGEGSQKVNLNTADIEELMTLNGIGETKAESILKYRERVGNFQTIEELMKVSGIGEALFERIRDDIVVE